MYRIKHFNRYILKAINAIQNNLQELVQFYPYAPEFQAQHRDDTGFTLEIYLD